MASGDYEASIGDHDQVIRLCTKVQRGCDASSVKKLELIKERCRNEVTLLQQIITEINGLKKPLSSAHKKTQCETKEEEDPDVWPPPTPKGGHRGGGSGDDDHNLPAWAKNNALQPSFPSRPEPSRRQSREPPSRGNSDVPANRRRYFPGSTFTDMTPAYFYIPQTLLQPCFLCSRVALIPHHIPTCYTTTLDFLYLLLT
mgnify:CR=1 FL=1